ncbi:hypothetical protein [Pseudoalteromonas sp. TB64]|uniref:hypothetical protein n=1 Tax=Pseudoalteromonas sp. TB64 TaxID=1938600 RepID=UPI0003F4AECF|nr:hypothetical protein [Pseudoalteromonas sp. TB64]
MELNRLDFNPRSRSSYEVFDLAILLTKKNFVALFSIYFTLVFPFFFIFGLLLGWSWSVFIVWWLKPLFERPLLDYLSKVIFNQRASIRSSIKAIFKLSLVNALTHLTFLRLSPNRALLAPVEQLENLSGERKKARKMLLFSSNKPKQTLWMLFCVHLELILMTGITGLVIALTPDSFSLEDQLYQFQSDPTWVSISFNFIYIISISLIAPLFVTGGFLAYLHRRIELEGWDLELKFKNMRSRLTNILPVLCLLISALFITATPKTYAQAIDKETIKDEVTSLYAEKDVIEKKTTWFPDFEELKENDEDNSTSPFLVFFSWIGLGLGYFAWFLVGGLALLLVYYAYKHKGFFKNRESTEKINKGVKHVIPTLFTDIKQADTPSDLMLAAKQAYEEGNIRLTLAYLLQFSLIWLQEKHNIVLHHSMTEKECLKAINKQIPVSQQVVFERLFKCWVRVAWAHQDAEFDFDELVDAINSLQSKDAQEPTS